MGVGAGPWSPTHKAVRGGRAARRYLRLLEHYLITKQVGEEKARELVDTYPHHLLHVHDREDS